MSISQNLGNFDRLWCQQKDRILIFLAQSNALAHAPKIDYSLLQNQNQSKGSFGAFFESQKAALIKRRIDVHELSHWQQMIAQEWQEQGKDIPIETHAKTKTRYLLAQLLDGLGRLNTDADPAQIVEIMANWLHDFEQLSPFKETSGPLCRLMLNYAATWSDHPLMIFNDCEKKSYQLAVKDLHMAHLYISQKIREAVFDHMGHLLERVSSHRFEDMYADNQGHQLKVEWHTLVA